MIRKIVLALLPVALTSVAIAADLKTFSANDVFELEYAGDPRIAPDGSRIVYERRSNDIMMDNTRSNIWIIDPDGGQHRPLVSGTQSASSPRWSNDSTRIAYVQSTDTGTGVYSRWMDSGLTALVANVQKTPSNLSWSPDGRWLAFSMPVPAESDPIAKPRSKPEGAEWSEPVKVIDTAQYRWDGRGFLEPAYDHIFVVPSDGGTPRQVTSGDYDHDGPFSWTPDGDRILFSSNQHDGWQLESGESDIFSVSVTDGSLVQLTDKPGGETSPTVSPNGRNIAYVYSANRMVIYNTRVLHVMGMDGSDDRALTGGLDRSVDNVQWAGDRLVFFQYDDRAVRKVASVDLDGDMTAIAEGLGSTSLGRPYTSGSFTVAEDGTVAYTYGT
ncbi:MAG: DPP IV N-terminal domain-containing protein, partial [Gammaproteobacteria bacterium]|nr:DPP IV N-terminal domain-containing protein [Gammaproteobacteria bacterium]